MSDSLIVVNFKTYQTAHGASAEDLARAMGSIDTVSYTHLTLPTKRIV